MKYVTLSKEQQIEAVRSRLQAAESQHLQDSAALAAGLDGYTEERVSQLEEGVKSLQARLKELEGDK